MSVHERAAFGGQLWFAGIQGGGLSASWICGCRREIRLRKLEQNLEFMLERLCVVHLDFG